MSLKEYDSNGGGALPDADPTGKPTELGRDLVPHINLMAAHGDPDYLKSNGMSIRHVDCRAEKTRRKSA